MQARGAGKARATAIASRCVKAVSVSNSLVPYSGTS